ncbi:DUF6537 domain-containing protein [uncultured Corynebacterium sp.]|uniref:DUF6537 domain-containing protein n=1 Tax=uncultured Corynebacterium sp. TaxID=159447 RepID=UPI0025D8DF2D|nr:DUF6537 domain-containing protein [uncultured Corynebacterium sp.]
MTSTVPGNTILPNSTGSRDVLADKYTANTGSVHLTGIQALVRMIRDRSLADRARGLNTASFISGYEGSPLGGYDLELARRATMLGEFNVVHKPAVNEELGATAAAGSQLTGVGSLRDGIDGVVGYWYGKAPGLDRSADALRHANLTGTSGKGGAVAIVGDDPTAKSSTVPSNSSRLLADLGMPTLVPADSSDILSLGNHAAWMSRYSGLWTSLRVTTAVADGSSTVTLDSAPVAPDVVNDEHTPDARLLGKRLLDLDATRSGKRLQRALEYARDHALNRFLHIGSADKVGIICAGNSALEVEQELRRLAHGFEVKTSSGIPRHVRVLRLGMTWPLDRAELEHFAKGLERLIVVEELGTFLNETVLQTMYGASVHPEIRQVNDPTTSLARELRDAGIDIAPPPAGPTRITLPINVATRVPHFCSGCPHNASTRASKDTLVGAGIGCHAMVMLMDTERVGDVIGTAQMGGEGAHWIGMAGFLQEKHLVQNMGDGTFLHSGSLALRAMVAANVNVTLKLLHNGTVAMTGGQDPVGQPGFAGLIDMVKAENPAKIVVTSDDVRRTRRQLRGHLHDVEVRDRGELSAVQEELAATPGVTVLVHDQFCAAEKRRARNRGKIEQSTTKVVINERICEGCGDCGAKSGCLSVQPVDTQFGRKTKIDQTSCNADFSCLDGDCPAFTTVTVAPEAQRASTLRGGPAGVVDAVGGASVPQGGYEVPSLQPTDLPKPTMPDLLKSADATWNVRVSGVGGTGVLTLAAVLATAAQLDGRYVRGNDMTGLAQKGGSVISDLRISALPLDMPGAVPTAGADLMFALDGVTGAEQNSLKVCSGQRTTAVVSSSASPTGRMVTDVTAQRPDGVQLAEAIAQSAHRKVVTDAMLVSQATLGATTFQTMVALGMALQAGAVPVSVDAIERALTANGKSVEKNIQALRWGRMIIADPQRVEKLVDQYRSQQDFLTVHARPGTIRRVMAQLPALAGHSALIETIAVHVDELHRWGSEADATRYLTALSRMVRAETRATSCGVDNGTAPFALTEAFAKGLFKLMAYKDEYEVARLATDSGFANYVAGEFGQEAADTLTFKLHPPVLRALGMEKKVDLPRRWAGPVLKGLAKMKPLRGTKWDLFGYADVRKLERELRDAYENTVLAVAENATDAKHFDRAYDLAMAADGVRGYEDLKLTSGRDLLETLAVARQELRRGNGTSLRAEPRGVETKIPN